VGADRDEQPAAAHRAGPLGRRAGAAFHTPREPPEGGVGADRGDLAADTRFHENLPSLLPQAPGEKDLFADEERREHAARFNATLQAGYFILAVRAAGLHAGPMGGFDAVGVDHDLLGDGPLKSIMIVNIGHPAEGGTFPRNPRLTSAEVVTTL
jgi:3-hydroxypropanoate dehydrogenase